MYYCNFKLVTMKSVVILVNIVAFALCENVHVTIPDGTLKGTVEREWKVPFYAFQQIPYAKPPVGELRFQAPQPSEKWKGVLDATIGNKICFQQANASTEQLELEDCLYLNVYTPEHPASNKSLPVMVHIYGGGFVDGMDNFYAKGPHYLLEGGVVIVAMNYRVGPFGFLTTGDTVIPGNFGLKDQLLALKWVQKNIKYFNGDPKKVTIFGESAGGASVAYHLMSKKSEGLFRAAIAESGTVLCPWAYQRDYKYFAYALATHLNPKFNKSASSQELLEYLRSVPAKKLKEAHQSFKEERENIQILEGFWFTPVIEPEHDDAFITELQYSAIKNGHMNTVPLMIGMSSEELIWWASDINGYKWKIQFYDSNVSALVNHNMKIKDNSQLKKVGNAIRKIYTSTTFADKSGSLIRFLSDTAFTRPIITHARLQSKFSDVYFYQFSYHGKLGGNYIYVEGAERVGHTEDMSYVWVNKNNTDINSYPAEDRLASQRYRTLMTNFVKYLNPTPEKSELFENIIWPKVTPTNFRYLNFNVTLTIEENPKGDVYPGWVKVYNEYAVKPYDTF